jgi:hypothetical protein
VIAPGGPGHSVGLGNGLPALEAGHQYTEFTERRGCRGRKADMARRPHSPAVAVEGLAWAAARGKECPALTPPAHGGLYPGGNDGENIDCHGIETRGIGRLKNTPDIHSSASERAPAGWSPRSWRSWRGPRRLFLAPEDQAPSLRAPRPECLGLERPGGTGPALGWSHG